MLVASSLPVCNCGAHVAKNAAVGVKGSRPQVTTAAATEQAPSSAAQANQTPKALGYTMPGKAFTLLSTDPAWQAGVLINTQLMLLFLYTFKQSQT